jgi:hypothetical protein
MVYQLGAQGTATTSHLAARLILPGSMTSVTLPAGILASGNAYYFVIIATKDGSYDPTTAPFAARKFPYGVSQTISGMVTP